MLPVFPPAPRPGWAPTERAHLPGRAQTVHAILVDQPMRNDRPSAFPVNSADARQGSANACPLSLSFVDSVRHCNLEDGATLVGQKPKHKCGQSKPKKKGLPGWTAPRHSAISAPNFRRTGLTKSFSPTDTPPA